MEENGKTTNTGVNITPEQQVAYNTWFADTVSSIAQPQPDGSWRIAHRFVRSSYCPLPYLHNRYYGINCIRRLVVGMELCTSKWYAFGWQRFTFVHDACDTRCERKCLRPPLRPWAFSVCQGLSARIASVRTRRDSPSRSSIPPVKSWFDSDDSSKLDVLMRVYHQAFNHKRLLSIRNPVTVETQMASATCEM